MVAKTSRKAYGEIQHQLGAKQAKVANAIYVLGSANLTSIGAFCSMQNGGVSARLNELRKMPRFMLHGEYRRVVLDCEKVCPTSRRTTMFWKLEDVNENL